MQSDRNKILLGESHLAASSKLSKDVVALGRKHAKTGFPNPNREGCPSRSTLRAIANRDRNLTIENIPASHIVTCSPCFQEYMQLRHRVLLFRGVRITAAALVAAAAIFIAARLFWNHGHQFEPNPPEKQLAGRGNRDAHPSSAEPVPLSIDLAAYSPTRGEANVDAQKKVRLPKRMLRLNFVLPLGMEPGTYEVLLEDVSGHSFFHKRARGTLNGGTTIVQVDIDLTAVAPGGFTLMIRPPGLDWRRFPGEVD